MRRRDTYQNRNNRIDRRLLFESEDDIIFEQDYASIHTAKLTQEWFESKGIDVIGADTPAKMDDFWPIERLWGIMIPIVYRDPEPQDVDTLRERVFEAWTHILPGTCQVLIHEMPCRLRKIVELKGHKITQRLKESEKCQCDFCIEWRLLHKHETVYRDILG